MSGVSIGMTAISIGVGIWQSEQAKSEAKKKEAAALAAYNTAQAAAQAAALREAQRLADQAAALKLISDANIKAKKAKTSRIVLILSIVGGTVLTAVTVIGLTLRSKNK